MSEKDDWILVQPAGVQKTDEEEEEWFDRYLKKCENIGESPFKAGHSPSIDIDDFKFHKLSLEEMRNNMLEAWNDEPWNDVE